MKTILQKSLIISLIFVGASLGNLVKAQVDTVKAAQPDTVLQQKTEKEKKEPKRKDEFIPYVGINFNQLSDMETDMGIGYHLGFNYKRGKFFYWQAGVRFNNAVYNMTDNADSTDNIGIRSLDIPVTGGINFLSFTNRILALRIFISAVPAFALGVGDNDFGYEKEDINSFILYGQAGLGINVAFLVIEAGYNFGVQDVFKDFDSKPGQIFVNLGFRF